MLELCDELEENDLHEKLSHEFLVLRYGVHKETEDFKIEDFYFQAKARVPPMHEDIYWVERPCETEILSL